MGRRAHNARYPSYSVKSWYGTMGRWWKQYHHSRERAYVRECLLNCETPVRKYPKGEAQNGAY